MQSLTSLPLLVVITTGLFASAPALAQVPTKEKPGAVKSDGPQDKKAVGESDATQDKKALIDTTKLLQRTLDKTKSERDFLKKVADEGGLLKRFKLRRKNARDMQKTFKPVELGPSLPTKKKARLLGDGEKGTLPKDVVFTVEGVPVTQKEFDAMVAYVKSYPQADGTAKVETAAIHALIERKAPQGVFRQTAKDAYSVMLEIKKRLDGGAKFKELAGQYSEDKASGAKGGKRGFLVRGAMDVSYAMHAFPQKIGQVSGVVAAGDGYHIIRTLGVKKGDTADQDSVRTAHIVRYYHSSVEKRAQVLRNVLTGQVDVAFRTDAMRKLAPKQFQ